MLLFHYTAFIRALFKNKNASGDVIYLSLVYVQYAGRKLTEFVKSTKF